MGPLLGYQYRNGILLGFSIDVCRRAKQPKTYRRWTNVVLGPHAHPAPELQLIFQVATLPYERIVCDFFPTTLRIAKNSHPHGDDKIHAKRCRRTLETSLNEWSCNSRSTKPYPTIGS